MTSFRLSGALRQTIAALSLGCTALGAQAGTYTFTQGGFDDGATVTGYFTGTDLNHDGILKSNELTDLRIDVHGGMLNGFQAGLGWYMRDFYIPNTLTYIIGSKVLGDQPGEEIWAQNYQFIYSSNHNYPGLVGPYPFGGYDVEAFSSSPIFVTDPSPAPEPETYAMMLAGLALVGFAARRKRTAA